MKNMKNKKGSVLAASLVILGIVLGIATSMATVSLRERKASIGGSKSNVAFQSADSGMEMVLQDMNEKYDLDISDLSSIDTEDCEVEVSNYAVSFYDKDGERITDCSTDISEVKKIKSVGTGGQTQRAIEAPACSTYALADGLVGWWPFDEETATGSPETTKSEDSSDGGHDATLKYDAQILFDSNCDDTKNKKCNQRSAFLDFGTLYEYDDYAVISGLGGYKKGAVSFWFYMRKAGNPNDQRVAFSMDEDGCSGDCGHLTFGWNWTDANAGSYDYEDNFSARLQDNGNSGDYQLKVDNISIKEENWYLATIVFNQNKYKLYINGHLESEIAGDLGALEDNFQNIVLGRIYGAGGNPDTPHSLKGYVDDLRIYDRTLKSCEVLDLFETTKENVN